MTTLSREQMQLLRDVVRKHLPSDERVIAAVEENTLTDEDRRRLCAAVGAEFAETGIDEESEPTPRGHELEALLDELNRPNLSASLERDGPPTGGTHDCRAGRQRSRARRQGK